MLDPLATIAPMITVAVNTPSRASPDTCSIRIGSNRDSSGRYAITPPALASAYSIRNAVERRAGGGGAKGIAAPYRRMAAARQWPSGHGQGFIVAASSVTVDTIDRSPAFFASATR